MKLMVKLTLLYFLATTALYAAEHQESFIYQGELEKSLELTRDKINVYYTEEEVDTTCTRQIPYEEDVCRDVTRYREQCHWEPGRDICRNHTEYERVCRSNPSRRVCRSVPERVCRTVNGRSRCRTVNRQVCRNVGGGTSCRQVPRTVRRCTHNPGRNICENIPYYENICNMETLYRTEEYGCKERVSDPHEEVVGQYKADVNFYFQNEYAEDVPFNVFLDSEGKVSYNTKSDNQESTVFVKLIHKEVEEIAQDHKQVTYTVALYSKDQILSPVSMEITKASFSKTKIKFQMGQIFEHKFTTIHVKIERKGKIFLDKKLTKKHLVFSETENRTKALFRYSSGLGLSRLKKYNFSITVTVDPQSEFEKKHVITKKFSARPLK